MEEQPAPVDRKPLGLAVFATGLVAFVFIGSSTCGKDRAVPTVVVDAPAPSASVAGDAGPPPGLSAPIAATRLANGDVATVALDVAAKSIRLLRIGPDDAIKREQVVIDDVAWASDADLKIWRAQDGVAIVWHGKRAGKLGRYYVLTGADLVPKRPPVEVAAGSCATEDALYATDGRRVTARRWSGGTHRYDLHEEDTEIDCAAHRAYALVDDEEKTSLVLLEGEWDAGGPQPDAPPATPDVKKSDAGADGGAKKSNERRIPLFDHRAFGEDEQRERAVYSVGDDIGVVRVSTTGVVTLRELSGGAFGPLRRVQKPIPSDDDVVAVDASPRYVVVVFTADASESCGQGQSATKVMALRIERSRGGDAGAADAGADSGSADADESVFDLAPGECGREIGPFFTGAVGDSVSIAWVERTSVSSKEKAPITGLVHRMIGASGMAPALGRVDQPADALADALCDDTRCYAAALARKPGADGMTPGFIRVLRYP